MLQKGFAHLVLLLVIGVVLVGGYFAYSKGYIQVNPNPNKHTDSMNYASPTPIAEDTTMEQTGTMDEMKDWKTYTNAKLGFTFKYPSAWKIKYQPDSSDQLETPDFKQNPDNHIEGEAQQGAFLEIPNTEIGFLDEELVNGHIVAGEIMDSEEISNVKHLMLNGQQATEYDHQGIHAKGITGTSLQFKTPKSTTKVYTIKIVYSSKTYKGTFDQIISTIKFIN
jgi:hypothetical protein